MLHQGAPHARANYLRRTALLKPYTAQQERRLSRSAAIVSLISKSSSEKAPHVIGRTATGALKRFARDGHAPGRAP